MLKIQTLTYLFSQLQQARSTLLQVPASLCEFVTNFLKLTFSRFSSGSAGKIPKRRSRLKPGSVLRYSGHRMPQR